MRQNVEAVELVCYPTKIIAIYSPLYALCNTVMMWAYMCYVIDTEMSS